MAFTVLASFSLLALVVTARPIVPGAGPQSSSSSIDLQSTVQAVFQSRTKQSADILGIPEDNFDIRFLSTEEQQAYLAQLDNSAIKALVPLDENRPLSEDEKKLIEMLGGSERMEDVEGASRLPDEDLSSQAELNADRTLAEDGEDRSHTLAASFSSAAPPQHSEPVIIAVSCVLALLSLACVSGFLYAIYYVRVYVLGNPTAWDLLPQLEKQQQLDRRFDDSALYGEKQKRRIGHRSKRAILPGGSEYFDEKAGVESDTDDEFEDAVSGDTTPTPTPRPAMVSLPLDVINPLLVPLPSSPTCGPVELEDSVSEFGTPSSTPRQRTVALPDEDAAPRDSSALDFALALQLRPGSGLGADPAWLMRFLMAVFGWVAVLVGGPARQPQVVPDARRRIMRH